LWANSRSGSVTGVTPLRARMSTTSEMRPTSATSVALMALGLGQAWRRLQKISVPSRHWFKTVSPKSTPPRI
jgi:hypothetical protein